MKFRITINGSIYRGGYPDIFSAIADLKDYTGNNPRYKDLPVEDLDDPDDYFHYKCKIGNEMFIVEPY